MTTPSPSGLITLLSDFGLTDPYVGVVKGVLLTLCPSAQIVDLCHDVPPQDIVAGAFWLERCHRWFPPGTIHVAIVDPGVGTARGALVATSGDHCFVGPDNGLLLPATRAGVSPCYRALRHDAVAREPLSPTFHGRDLFAPAAAAWASGRLAFEQLGDETTPSSPGFPRATTRTDGAMGQVIVVDRFGNLITNIEPCALRGRPAALARVAGRRVSIGRTFADAEPGQPLAYVGSFGTWEIAVRDGSAARQLATSPGATVEVVTTADGSC